MIFFISASERKHSLTLLLKLAGFILLSGGLLLVISYLGNRQSGQLTNLNVPPTINVSDIQFITIGSSQNWAINDQLFQQPLLRLESKEQTYRESHFIVSKLKDKLDSARLVLMPVFMGSLGVRSEVRQNLLAQETPNAWLGAGPLETINYHFLVFYRGITNWFSYIDRWLHQLFIFTNNNESDHDIYYDKVSFLMANSYHKDRLQQSMSELAALTQLVNQLDACLILYQSPVSTPFEENFISQAPETAQWKNTIRDFIAELDNRYCIHFIEGFWPADHANNFRLYLDKDHLNDKGAALFTPMLKARLCELPIMSEHSEC